MRFQIPHTARLYHIFILWQKLGQHWNFGPMFKERWNVESTIMGPIYHSPVMQFMLLLWLYVLVFG